MSIGDKIQVRHNDEWVDAEEIAPAIPAAPPDGGVWAKLVSQPDIFGTYRADQWRPRPLTGEEERLIAKALADITVNPDGSVRLPEDDVPAPDSDAAANDTKGVTTEQNPETVHALTREERQWMDELTRVAKERDALKKQRAYLDEKCERLSILNQQSARRIASAEDAHRRGARRVGGYVFTLLLTFLLGLGGVYRVMTALSDQASELYEAAEARDAHATATAAATQAQIDECTAAADACAAEQDDTYPGVRSAADGYYVEGEIGRTFVPWPDASRYPADRFTDDCTAVCATPERAHTSDLDSSWAPGRVLVVDPPHLTCICFHEGAFWPVERWVGWVRVQ